MPPQRSSCARRKKPPAVLPLKPMYARGRINQPAQTVRDLASITAFLAAASAINCVHRRRLNTVVSERARAFGYALSDFSH
jgi:hypothetical protein